jgi:hypothetical protein
VVDTSDSVQFSDLMPDNMEELFVNIPLVDLAQSYSASAQVPNIEREILLNRRIPDACFSFITSLINKEQELKTALIGASSSSGPLLLEQGPSGSGSHHEEVVEPQIQRPGKGIVFESDISVSDALEVATAKLLDESAPEDEEARKKIAMRKAYEEGE